MAKIVDDEMTGSLDSQTKIAREQARFWQLLAGNLVAVGFLAVTFCAQFDGAVALWFLQAPYFATGGAIVLVVTPLEQWFLHKVHVLVPNVFIESVAVAIASVFLAIPGGLIVVVVALADPKTFMSGYAGVLGYFFVGGFMVAVACLFCAFIGRLIAQLFMFIPRLSVIVYVLSAVNVGIAVAFIATRI